MARLAIRMPKMSMTMAEGDVGSWMVEVGDEVAVGDVVAEVMTDKVDMEVESTVAGTVVEIVHESGTVKVGEPIGWVEGEDDGGDFGDLLSEPAEPDQPDEPDQPAGSTTTDEPPAVPDETSDEPPDASDTTHHAPEPEPQPAQDAMDGAGQRAAGPGTEQGAEQSSDSPMPAAPPLDGPPQHATPPAAVPRARGLALEHGIDLAGVAGTGPDRVIRVADVEALIAPADPDEQRPDATVSTAQPGTTRSTRAQPAVAVDRKSAVRAVVAKTMTPSAAIPQFTVWREVELDGADAVRRGISWTTVLLRSYAAALRSVPDLLCRWDNGRATEAGPPAIALAVATDRGLLVPIFAEPDRVDPRELDQEIRAVVRDAHGGKVDKRYLGAANGSLSNLGRLGVDRFQALLTPPQARRPDIGLDPAPTGRRPGGVGLALTVHAGITVDHRVADGAHAAHVLAALAGLLGASGVHPA